MFLIHCFGRTSRSSALTDVAATNVEMETTPGPKNLIARNHGLGTRIGAWSTGPEPSGLALTYPSGLVLAERSGHGIRETTPRWVIRSKGRLCGGYPDTP